MNGPIFNVRTSSVFVPGGMPNYTYVVRRSRELQEKLESAQDNLCKLITLTGSTKSGKTVLVNKVYPRNGSNIWIDGGTVRTEDDFWQIVLERIQGFTTYEENVAEENKHEVSGDVSGGLKLPIINFGTKVGGKIGKNKSEAKTRGRQLSARTAAIAQLKKSKIPIIIDDFHYLERDIQANIIRALKPLIFEGQPVILIAIPHRRYDAVKVEREMTGRIEHIRVPQWSSTELLEISALGFELLRVEVSDNITSTFSSEAYGSPHLMQEFCRNLLMENDITETLTANKQINFLNTQLFHTIAGNTGRVIFDKLAKGPRQRSDRIVRTLHNGDEVDIYKVTLLAMARLKPQMEKVDYEQLRTEIRNILATNLPQAHEVSRVLEKMAEIASLDESSIPVIDWDKEERCLHITDPFFAFFLRWGIGEDSHLLDD